MTKFVFIGGKQPSEGIHTDAAGAVTLDESKNPTDVPATCFAFGINWQLGVPVDVTRDKFSTPEHYQNALKRLENNRFFERFAEEAKFEEVAPAAPVAKAGKKGKHAPVDTPADEPVE